MVARVLVSPRQSADALKELSEWADELRLAYAWISSSRGRAHHWRVLDLAKVTRAVVGIQFAQTEPAALHDLASPPGRLMVVEDTSGVFHPKVIVGINGTEARAIVGSSNLTVGGFSGNTELNILVVGSAADEPLVSLINFIDDHWTSARAFAPDADWFERYEHAHRKQPKPPRVPQPKRLPRVVVTAAEELDVGWNDYYDLVAGQERRALADGFEVHVFDHPEGSYLQEAEGCQAAFADHKHFAEMPEERRKLVAGWGGGTSGYFGRMGGAGNFKRLVRTDPKAIGDYFDAVPLEGRFDTEDAGRYLNSMLGLEGISLATATRLLTVKRPDLFLPINNGNRRRIRQVFGSAPSSVASYLALHDRIWSLPWATALRPDGRDPQRVWEARVALLDTLLYELP